MLLMIVLVVVVREIFTNSVSCLSFFSASDFLLSLKNLIVGIFIPELTTIFVLLFLINAFHNFFKINQVQLSISGILGYEILFLPLFLVSYLLFFPITLHVRFLLREFPHYSLDRYNSYYFGSFSVDTYFMYLPFIILLGYILINVSLMNDFLRPVPKIMSAPGVFVKPEVIDAIVEVSAKPAIIVPSYSAPIIAPAAIVKPEKSYLKILSGVGSEETVFLKVEKCYCFEIANRFCYAQHTKGLLRISAQINELELQLDPVHFFTVRRGFIINMDYVESVNYWEKGKYLVLLKVGEKSRQVTMSIKKAADFKEALRTNRLHRLGTEMEQTN